MRRWFLIGVVLVLVLAGCGGASAPAASEPSPETPVTAEAVHQAWVQALRDNDRAIALRLMAPQIDPAYTDSVRREVI